MRIFIINNFFPAEQIGGSEIQCELLAKYFSERNHIVTYVALQGLRNVIYERKNDFDIHYLSNKNEKKIIILKRFYELLKKEKPDICYIRIFKYLFLLYRICKFLKIPVVFNTSHINDCQPDMEKIKPHINPIKLLRSIRIVIQRRLNFSVLKKIAVVTINKYHTELLFKKYNIKSTTIYNSMEDNYEKNRAVKQKQVVYVNNIKIRKRPELFIELVNKINENSYKFLMIGALQNNVKYYKNLINECEKNNKNFEYLGVKTSGEVDKILSTSEIFVNTCEPEGFGNNFIQAWLNECPTITLSFDPDDVIKKNEIGYHSETIEKMIKDVKGLINNGELRKKMGKKAREYALQNHNIRANIIKYEAVFKKEIHEQNIKKT